MISDYDIRFNNLDLLNDNSNGFFFGVFTASEIEGDGN